MRFPSLTPPGGIGGEPSRRQFIRENNLELITTNGNTTNRTTNRRACGLDDWQNRGSASAFRWIVSEEWSGPETKKYRASIAADPSQR